MTHLDLSGIESLTRDDVLKLINVLSNYNFCGNLLSIHLDDLGINDDEQLIDEAHELFNVNNQEEEEADNQGGLYLGLQMYLKKVRGLDYNRKIADSFNYTNVIQKAINGSKRFQKEHNILLGLHMKMLGHYKLMGHAGLNSKSIGIGRNIQKGTCYDKFILVRANNMPELVFNQNNW